MHLNSKAWQVVYITATWSNQNSLYDHVTHRDETALYLITTFLHTMQLCMSLCVYIGPLTIGCDGG